MSGTKKRYKSTYDLEKEFRKRESIKNIKLASSFTKRKFSSAVNALKEKGLLYDKSVKMIKHIYDVSGKGERGILIKHIMAGVQTNNKSEFLRNLNLDITKKGFSKVVIETKAILKEYKYKDNEATRYYHELAKAYAKGKILTKYERIKLQKKVERDVYKQRMKDALKRPDLNEVIRRLLEDSLAALGMI